MNRGFGIQRDDERRHAHDTPPAGGVAGGSKHIQGIAVWILPACALVAVQAVKPTSARPVATADWPVSTVKTVTDRARDGEPIPRANAVVAQKPITRVPDVLLAGLVKVHPVPRDTFFERHVVAVEAAGVVAGAERRIYSNSEGHLFVALGGNKLVADDITTTAPHNTVLGRYTFQVTGKANPAGPGGPYSVEFALYGQCPQSVLPADRSGLIIPGTAGTASFPDDAPRQIEFAVPGDVTARLPTNFFLGVKLSHDNVGIVMGAPAFEGHSADNWDFPSFPCASFLGGFPEQPHASFNAEIFDREDSGETHVEYKAQRLSGPTFNPGGNVWLVDDLQLLTPNCEMVAYEVGIRGEAVFDFEFRNSCNSSAPMPGTKRLLNNIGDGLRLYRVELAKPVPLPQNPWFAVKVTNTVGGTVVAGVRPTIGDSADFFGVINAEGVCRLQTVGTGIHAAVHLTVTCAGPAPKGACCDMFILDEDGEAVCRQLAEINCPFPLRDTGLRPAWREGDACDPNPFEEGTCGQAACCFKDVNDDEHCVNFTRNECAAELPPENPRQWELGRFCGLEGQRCPVIDCLFREGSCFEAHWTTGCDDPFCCGDVCVLPFQEFCCEVEWDLECVAAAQEVCTLGACCLTEVKSPCPEISCHDETCQNLTKVECTMAGGIFQAANLCGQGGQTCPFDDCNGNGIDDAEDLTNCEGDPACGDCDLNKIPDGCQQNADGDDLIDECDGCPESRTSAAIMIGLCDTGVINIVFDDGCTMTDVLAECYTDLRSHGDYVTCVNETARAWKRSHLITGSEFADIVACAAESNTGRSKRPERAVGKLTTGGKN